MSQGKHHYFATEDEEVDLIVEDGMRKYVEDLDDLGVAFRGTDRILRCMDEGTPRGIVHRAGSGYNFGLKDAIAFCQRAHVSAISWHAFCGAVKLHLAGEGMTADELSDKRVDAEAREFAEELATALGVPCVEEELSRPDTLHVARCVYYDGTGQFDQSLIDRLPTGFAISRAFEEVDKAKWQAEVACGIAFDEHHGFGELFTIEKPFLLVAIGKNDEEARALEAELQEVVAALVDEHPEVAERIKVDSFSMQS